MTALNVDQLDWKEKVLDVPTLNEVAAGKYTQHQHHNQRRTYEYFFRFRLQKHCQRD